MTNRPKGTRWHPFTILILGSVLAGIASLTGADSSTLNRSLGPTPPRSPGPDSPTLQAQPGPWDLSALAEVPPAAWGGSHGALREVFYESVPYEGRPTAVFAYYGHPTNGNGPFPALVLVHGSGMTADIPWAEFWVNRGYAVLAMDLNGLGPDGVHLTNGGPTRFEMFRPFTEAEVTQTWVYQAVAHVIHGHSWLAAQPQVDARRIGIHGISTGGMLTAIAAGLDHRLAAAAPVFGAGYLNETPYFSEWFLQLGCVERARWMQYLDASRYLGGASCPILFASGASDPFFSPASFQRSFLLIPEERRFTSVKISRSHGRIWELPGMDVEVTRFFDHVLQGAIGLPWVSSIRRVGDQVSAEFRSPLTVREAYLMFTTDLGPWTERGWAFIPARIQGATLQATLPTDRPLAYALTLTDAGLASATSPYVFAADHDDAGQTLALTDLGPVNEAAVFLRGSKPFAHRVVLQGSADGCSWTSLATDPAASATFEVSLPIDTALATFYYRLRDPDW